MMGDKNISAKNVTVKTEPVSPASKKIIISSPLISPGAIKKEPSTRLPSFKPPRDLLLTGSTATPSGPALKNYMNNTNKANKRKYTPNVNIFRKKGSNSSSAESPTEVDAKNKSVDQSKKNNVKNRKKNANFIQTKGVFSEGVAPGKVKAFHSSYSERSYNESNVLEKPKLVLNQKINKSKEDAKLSSLLRDDFIDDPNNIPDLTFVPSSLPTVYNSKAKCYDPRDIEKTFENLQVKTEKLTAIKVEDLGEVKSELCDAFEGSDSPKLLLFEFPKIIQGLEDSGEKKKSSKTQPNNETESKTKLGNLSSAGEGHWGYLRIHESGNAYFVVGTTVIPISLSKHIARQELMSTSIDQSRCKGEIINLGTIDASFTCSTNFSDIHD